MHDTERLLELIGKKSTVELVVGTFVGMSNGKALVDVNQSRFPASLFDGQIPAVNDPVHVLSLDGRWLMVGPTRAKPRVGTVVTVSSPNVSILTSQGTISAIIGGATPGSGDRVLIDWTEDGPVSGLRLANTPVAPVPPPDPGGGGATIKEATFRAVDAGSTDRGAARWWQAQPWASNSTYGAWFYGSQIKDTIPATATFVSMEIYINRVQDSGSAPNFTLHTLPVKTGVPPMSGPLAWDPANGWNTVPNNGWFAALIAGGAYYGIGLNQGGFNKFASLAEDGFSGALRIKWK